MSAYAWDHYKFDSHNQPLELRIELGCSQNNVCLLSWVTVANFVKYIIHMKP